jgi:hypothetical protein
MVILIINNGDYNSPNLIFKLFPIHIFIMIETIVLFVIYLKDVFNNKYIEESKRVLWVLVLFFGNMIAMPIYWYINIWKHIEK